MLLQQPLSGPSASQIMLKAKTFKVLLCFTIFFIVVSGILGIIAANVTCSNYNQFQCSDYFNYSHNQCSSGTLTYCCGQYYDANLPYYNCGNFNYCYKMPQNTGRGKCTGLAVVASVFLGLTFLMLIFHLILFCHYKGIFNRLYRDPLNRHLLKISQNDYSRLQQQKQFDYFYCNQRMNEQVPQQPQLPHYHPMVENNPQILTNEMLHAKN